MEKDGPARSGWPSFLPGRAASHKPSGELSAVYVPVDKELAKQNTNYPLAFLRQFYRDAYAAIRRHMGTDKYVVFADAFVPDDWRHLTTTIEFEGVMAQAMVYINGELAGRAEPLC